MTAEHVENQWESATDHLDQAREIHYLIRMGKLDYSPSSGRLKART